MDCRQQEILECEQLESERKLLKLIKLSDILVEIINEVRGIVMNENTDIVRINDLIDILTQNTNQKQQTLEIHILKQIYNQNNHIKQYEIKELTDKFQQELQTIKINQNNLYLWWNSFKNAGHQGNDTYLNIETLIQFMNSSPKKQEINKQLQIFKTRNLWTKQELFKAIKQNSKIQ